MATPISLFDYSLPEERIAQTPVEPRDSSKLLVLNRETGALKDNFFYQIIDELRAGDVLVLNNSKVFKARLHGVIGSDSDFKPVQVEVFLLRGQGKIWETLIRPGKKVLVGDRIKIGELTARVLEKQADGVVRLEFDRSATEVIAYADAYGEVPLPPYIQANQTYSERYQTVYADPVGSVAAPTAGLHFTPGLIEKIKTKGVLVEFITLHVGLGTFRPVKTETIEEHEMHSELVEISVATAEAILTAKKERRRVIAVGTTSVRALDGSGVPITGFTGDLNIFITPGYKFKIVDGLITNFHLPKSTLLMLVSALAGRENILVAYGHAISTGYRFYSFGDAMFIQ